MTKIRDSVVLITGGAAGIGKLMGERCLKGKARCLVIWDINEENLDKTTAEFREHGYEIHPYVVDVSKLNDIKKAAADVKENVGNVNILFNNAGVVVGKNFIDHTHKDIDFTVDINVSALMHVALEFLPGMVEENKGHVINISSAAGLLANPRMSVYAGSKWAVAGWSESLRLELEKDHPKVKVTTVHPSYIDTGMFTGAKVNPLVPVLKPEYAAKEIVKAVKRNEILLHMPALVKVLPFLKGTMPTRMFDLLVGKGMNVYDSMAHFSGHKN
ncbi:MAG: SDR family oxidoreductase [Bacteroidota bacterium]